MGKNTAYSFTSAETFPLKLFIKYNEIKKDYRFVPIHIQVSPTNKCNLNCPFCSCSKRDRELELDFGRLKKFVDVASELGSQACTITGGGEPTMYPYINEFILYLKEKGIKAGMVTNGHGFHKLNNDALNYLTWVRVSLGDGRTVEKVLGMSYFNKIKEAMARSSADFSFSYVVSPNPDFALIEDMINFCNANQRITHIRFVCDITQPEESAVGMKEVIKFVKKIAYKYTFEKCIFQTRTEFEKGKQRCLVSLVKPFLYTDGYIYPCCSVQYALRRDYRDVPEIMRMSDKQYEEGLRDIYERNIPFNGSICNICYYNNYNEALEVIEEGIKHIEFV